MKQSDIKHILEEVKEEPEDKELVFYSLIHSNDGGKCMDLPQEIFKKPDEWDNVKPLVGNLYYACNNDAKDEGVVYVGEFQ